MFVCSTTSTRKNDCTRTCQSKSKLTAGEKNLRIEDIRFQHFVDENKSEFLITIQSIPHREHNRHTLL
jgi:hypothetical protein